MPVIEALPAATMIGLVVVSHSRALALAAVALAGEMVQGQNLRIAIAAGLDDETFGTDAVRIHDALLEADDGDGVVVLMDLGSAVLSAELALDLLEDDAARDRVLLCPAPLVEGLVVAAVTAASGASRAEVAAEAVAALAGKQSQLGSTLNTNLDVDASADTEKAFPELEVRDGEGETERVAEFVVRGAHGLHARPAALLVRLVQGLDARVELRNLSTGSGARVPAASLSRVATLGARQGDTVEVSASGRQAGEALEQILALAARDFDEAPHDSAVGVSPSQSVLLERTVAPGAETPSDGPFPASPGIGIGPALTMAELGRIAHGRARLHDHGGKSDHGAERDGVDRAGEDSGAGGAEDRADSDGDDGGGEYGGEYGRLERAVGEVRDELRGVRARVAREVGESEAAIFDAHLALLDDPELLGPTRAGIKAGCSAGDAWAQAARAVQDGFEALADPYLRGRAADVRAVADQVLDRLTPAGVRAEPTPGDRGTANTRPGVLVAADLTPAQAAGLDPEHIAAVVLAFGSPTAHSALLIRARSIPAVVGAGPEVLRIEPGTTLAVDGTRGELAIDPPEPELARFRARSAAASDRDREARTRSGSAALTRDGVQVLVGANVGSVEDASAAAAAGADLVGLVRTEFLFLDRAQAPDVDEQESVYRALAEAVDGRRLTLRTLDVGGDKPLRYLPMPAEANPFLGVRGLRLALRHPRLLADQLLAIVRVAHDVPVSVMFPMVSTLDELVRARRALAAAIREEGRGEPAGLQVGIMVEVPAAALKTATLAPELDFLSIGTNDLTQYTLAAERGNQAVAALGDPLDPGVLQLIAATCRGAGRALVAVCGELAADERAAAVLAGLGVRELSVTPRAVPGVKQAVRGLELPQAQALAARALGAPSADAVRDLLGR